MSRIGLTLDLASVTGWAVGDLDTDARPLSGIKRLARPESSLGMIAAAYREFLGDMIAVHKPSDVAIEAPWLSPGETSRDAALILFGLVFDTHGICHERGIGGVRLVNVEDVRRHFIGTKHGRREELKRRVRAKCREKGWDPIDDNEADALAIFDFARVCLKPRRAA